jgi:hypothetical protein
MSILSDFEDRLARAVEGAFAGAFRSPVQPAELARALAHAMDDGKSAGVGKVYAPSVYTIELSRDDTGKLGDAFEHVLAAELSTFLIDHARKRGYTLAGSPVVNFRVGRGLKLGRFRVGSEMASDRAAAPASARAATPTAVPSARPSAASATAPPLGGAVAPAASRAPKPFVPAPGTSLPAPAPATPAPRPATPASPSGPAFFDHEAAAAAPTPEPQRAVPMAVAAASVSTTPHPDARPASLLVGEHGHEVVLRGSRFEIGRTAECDIQVEDANVSRHHAVLVARDGGWVVEDLGSTNGTWIAGERVSSAPLADGTIITVGATHLVFRDGRG